MTVELDFNNRRIFPCFFNRQNMSERFWQIEKGTVTADIRFSFRDGRPMAGDILQFQLGCRGPTVFCTIKKVEEYALSKFRDIFADPNRVKKLTPTLAEKESFLFFKNSFKEEPSSKVYLYIEFQLSSEEQRESRAAPVRHKESSSAPLNEEQKEPTIVYDGKGNITGYRREKVFFPLSVPLPVPQPSENVLAPPKKRTMPETIPVNF